MLGEQLKILSELELDFDLETIGFEVPEIDLLIDGHDTVSEADCQRSRSLQPPVRVIFGTWASTACSVETR